MVHQTFAIIIQFEMRSHTELTINVNTLINIGREPVPQISVMDKCAGTNAHGDFG